MRKIQEKKKTAQIASKAIDFDLDYYKPKAGRAIKKEVGARTEGRTGLRPRAKDKSGRNVERKNRCGSVWAEALSSGNLSWERLTESTKGRRHGNVSLPLRLCRGRIPTWKGKKTKRDREDK